MFHLHIRSQYQIFNFRRTCHLGRNSTEKTKKRKEKSYLFDHEFFHINRAVVIYFDILQYGRKIFVSYLSSFKIWNRQFFHLHSVENIEIHEMQSERKLISIVELSRRSSQGLYDTRREWIFCPVFEFHIQTVQE